MVVFALTTLLLAIAGILKGEARAIPLWPNWSGLGDNPAGIAASVVAMLPVILNADACHQVGVHGDWNV